MSLIVVILIILLLFGGVGTLPTWGHSAGWGYGPSGIIGVILLVIVILALTGRL
jgi:hypothetical protein